MIEPVDLELAKILKAEGYSKPCEFYWLDKDLPFVKKGLKQTKDGKKLNHNRFDEFIYSAPNRREAIDWLIGVRMYYQSSIIINCGRKTN